MKKKSPLQKQNLFTDLRELEKHISKLQTKKEKEDSLFYIHRIPELPEWTDKIYSSQDYRQNLYKLKCSCDEHKKLNKKYNDRDIRLVCKHLYWKLTSTKVKDEIDALTKLLLESFYKNKDIKLFKGSVKNKPMILGFTNSAEWINVFIENDKWRRFSFNTLEKRWAYGGSPDEGKLIETKINTILNYTIL